VSLRGGLGSALQEKGGMVSRGKSLGKGVVAIWAICIGFLFGLGEEGEGVGRRKRDGVT